MKSDSFDDLIKSMSKCQRCLKLKDKSLINFYGLEMAKNIPSIWTDWYNHLDSDIMIVGQDWGPFKDMEKLYQEYSQGKDYQELIASEKSLTKKKLYKYLEESLKMQECTYDLKEIYITNAIMCARTGNNYRGNNINLAYSTKCCSTYLSKQIDIVKPRVIATLGYYPLKALSVIYDFKIEKNLTSAIEKQDVIRLDNIVIVPLFHPTAQISNERQLKQYRKIWESLGEIYE